MPLYLIPLVGASLAFGRWWVVLLLTTVIAAVGFLLGALTPQMDIAASRVRRAIAERAGARRRRRVDHRGVDRTDEQRRAKNQRSARRTDALTGLLNLRSFEEILQQEHRKAERFGRPYTVVVVDVDNLATITETMGHEARSQILGAVAAAITRSIRNSDVAARLGGDEFVVLLTGSGLGDGWSDRHAHS